MATKKKKTKPAKAVRVPIEKSWVLVRIRIDHEGSRRQAGLRVANVLQSAEVHDLFTYEYEPLVDIKAVRLVHAYPIRRKQAKKLRKRSRSAA